MKASISTWIPSAVLVAIGLAACSASTSTETTGDASPDTERRTTRDVGTLPDTAFETDVRFDAAEPADVATDDDAEGDTLPRDIGVPDAPSRDTGAPDATAPDDAAPDTGGFSCSEKLEYVYVMTKEKELYQFDPDSAEFTLVGAVDCDEFLDTTPASMAMSRRGVAWVNYSDSSLQSVDIDDAACSATGWTGANGFDRFGMAYVADTVGGDETLYIANATTLAEVDTSTWAVRIVGSMTGQSELAGTGRGELWGFFPLASPPQLRQLSRDDASVIATYDLPPLPPGLDTFAFTAWGGEFYIFYRLSGLGQSTTVYRFDPRDATLTRIAEDTGINVVGAGVSICAPTSR